jgi:hypothetical protein
VSLIRFVGNREPGPERVLVSMQKRHLDRAPKGASASAVLHAPSRASYERRWFGAPFLFRDPAMSVPHPVPPVDLWLLIGRTRRCPFDPASLQVKLSAGKIDPQAPACPVGSQTWLGQSKHENQALEHQP